MTLNRRDFVQTAAAIGASLAWSGRARASSTHWRDARNFYPEGVASGDPDPTSVILWTRRPFESGGRQLLTVEVADDQNFSRVIAHAPALVSAASDWTTRVLVGGLKPSHTYWYRFTDAEGNGSRIGRTRTAPLPNDARPVNFAFVSCQSVNDGKLNAYRRMIFEDEHAAPEEQLDFILHLGDFIYEIVIYPEDQKERYGRPVYEVARIPDALKAGKWNAPTTVEGYRAVYKGYLKDPDLQDARARWPFVAMWDNHEFSFLGWQSLMNPGTGDRPGQAVKVAANQAWFEYLPARVAKPGGPSLERFDPPAVKNVPIERFDSNGLGDEPNNLTAIRSLRGYRALRYGSHLDLIITDQHSYRSQDPTAAPDLKKLGIDAFLGMFPEDVMEILDGGRNFNGGSPPAEISFGDVRIPNPQKNAPPQTILGAEQKTWFKDRLRRSTATWKIWGNSEGAIDLRADPQNLPTDFPKPWPSQSYATLGGGDYGTAYLERAEIYDLVHDAGISGFAIVSGDRHSFWAGYATKGPPSAAFEPVGLSFVGASLASLGAGEANAHNLAKDNPLRPLFVVDRPDGGEPDMTMNMLTLHGVRSCLDYAQHRDLKRARLLSNPALSPQLTFLDWSAQGYAKVRLSNDEMRTEFVCIEHPATRSDRPDGGPLRYRVAHTAKLWRPGERPKLEQQVLEGDPGLSI